jgi:hypothetical protein
VCSVRFSEHTAIFTLIQRLMIVFITEKERFYCEVGRVRYGTVWCGTVRYGTVWYGTVRNGAVRCGMLRYGKVRDGTVGSGPVR